MGLILDEFGQPVGGSSRFLDAAQQTNRRPTWPVRTEGILRAVNTFDWRTVLYASRRLYANMGIPKGAIKQKASFSVGRAWQPVFQGLDKDWGKIATQWLTEIFYPMCEVRGGAFDFTTSLNVDSIAIDRDGGYGVLLTETADGFPQTQRIPIHRFGARYEGQEKTITEGDYAGCRIYQGIIYAPGGIRPVAYRIYTDPVNQDTPPDDAFEDISARDLIHVYEPEWYDQGHGFPAFTHAINELRDVKTASEWEQLAMLSFSETALSVFNETGQADPNDPTLQLGRGAQENGGQGEMHTEVLAGGRIRYFRSGSGDKIENIGGTRPGPDWESFNDRLIRAALYGINWPYSMAWKADGGGTDKRDDISQARQSVCTRQDVLRPVAKRIIGYAVSKAIKRGDIPAYKGADIGGQLKWSFQMPARMTIDDGRAADARREDYKLGLNTHQEISSEGGGNWEVIRDQREIEVDDLFTRASRLAEKHKVTFDQALMYLQQNTPNQQAVQGEMDVDPKNPAAATPQEDDE